jgi:hypothetical protein
VGVTGRVTTNEMAILQAHWLQTHSLIEMSSRSWSDTQIIQCRPFPTITFRLLLEMVVIELQSYVYIYTVLV